jgi:DNA-binding FadR family transcriptional regulator
MPPDEPSMPLVLNTGQHRAMTAHVFVRDTLREAIVSGALAGGTRLIQAELAAQLNVSNTPIREALRDLAGEGLVEFDPHRGSRVRLLQLDEAREIYEMRIALEPLMVRRAVSIVSSAQLDRAEQLCGRMERTTNLSRWSELNREFHSLLAVSDPTARQLVDVCGDVVEHQRESARRVQCRARKAPRTLPRARYPGRHRDDDRAPAGDPDRHPTG